MITTQKALREAFWEMHPEYQRKGRQTQNDYPPEVRFSWCDFVDYMERNGEISESLAYKATL